jgi:hypothetical protein
MFTPVGGECDQCSGFGVSQLDYRLFDMDSRSVLRRIVGILSIVLTAVRRGVATYPLLDA